MRRFNRWAARYVDKHMRSPRNLGFAIDNGVADRGTRYGGANTIHNTGTIDIVMENGLVTEVWFRCRQLPFQVSSPKGSPVYGQGGNPIVAIEFDDVERY